MKGKFITFEGGEGSGKTTIIDSLVKKLNDMGYNTLSTREPGGSLISEQIRAVILNVDNTKMEKETETLLYAASRVQHLKEKVIPALENGYIVICDRYLDSSIAYQGFARGVGVDKVLKANSFALDYMPDLTIFIDVKPEVAMKRLSNRKKIDRLDLESMEFHKKVYEGYKYVANTYKDRVISINGNDKLNDVISNVIKEVIDFIISSR